MLLPSLRGKLFPFKCVETLFNPRSSFIAPGLHRSSFLESLCFALVVASPQECTGQVKICVGRCCILRCPLFHEYMYVLSNYRFLIFTFWLHSFPITQSPLMGYKDTEKMPAYFFNVILFYKHINICVGRSLT